MVSENPQKQNNKSESEMEEARRMEELQRFRREIAEIREKEESGEIASGRGHFRIHPGFTVEDLSEKDRAIWSKVKDQTIEESDWDNYRKEFIDPETRTFKKDMPRSRVVFMAFIANKISPIFYERDKKKREKR